CELLDHAAGAAIDPTGGDLLELELRQQSLDVFSRAFDGFAQSRKRNEVLASGQTQVERSLLRKRGPDASPRGAATGGIFPDRDHAAGRGDRACNATKQCRL